MKNMINKLTEKHYDEIRETLSKISNYDNSKSLDLYTKNLGSTISEIFNIFDLEDYYEYVDILTELDNYDPLLSRRLEDYLIKEVNLVALLAFHIAVKNNDYK